MMMRRRSFSFVLGALLSRRTANASTKLGLGTLTRFYRGTQLQGHLLGMGLVSIPQYLLEGVDIKYKRNPALTTEIPFVDTFTINRFLGGYPPQWLGKYGLWEDRLGRRSMDYAIKAADGSLQYRSELIRKRLAPYLAAGYRAKDITIALENVPWDLARAPEEGPWGQRSPPANSEEWKHVIGHFAEDLKRYLGPEASNVIFETGVEYDERVSFNATYQQFYRYFSDTYQALRVVLPDAILTPGEFTGTGECAPSANSCVYDTHALIDFCQANKIIVPVVPRSLQALFSSNHVNPSTIVQRARLSYNKVPATPEIHQFGLLGQPFGDEWGSDPGPVQASWQFQVLMGLWQEVRPKRVFHWGGLTSVGRHHFLNGSGFLRLILDGYLGSQFVVLPVVAKTPVDVDSELMAVGISGRSGFAIIVSSFSRQASTQARVLHVHLPDSWPVKTPQLKVLRYRASDNVFTKVRQNLATEKNLKLEFLRQPSCVSEPLIMAKEPSRARVMIEKNWGEYVELMQRDLRWQPEHETWVEGRSVIRSRIESNELLVIEAASGHS